MKGFCEQKIACFFVLLLLSTSSECGFQCAVLYMYCTTTSHPFIRNNQWLLEKVPRVRNTVCQNDKCP